MLGPHQSREETNDSMILELLADMLDDLSIEGKLRRKQFLSHMRQILLFVAASSVDPTEQIKFATPSSYEIFESRLANVRTPRDHSTPSGK